MLISNSRAKVQRSEHNTKEIPKFFSLLSSKRTFDVCLPPEPKHLWSYNKNKSAKKDVSNCKTTRG